MNATPDVARIPVAIIGMGCRFPGADDLQAFWRLLVDGRSAVGVLPPDRFDQDLYYDPEPGVRFKSYSRLGAVLSHRRFDRQSCPIPAELEQSVDITHLLMCEVAAAACRDAGFDPFALPLRNTGVYVGHCQGSTLAGDYVFGTCVEEAAQFLREVEEFHRLAPDAQEAVLREFVAETRAALPSHDVPRPDCAANMAAGTITKAFGLTGPFMAVNSACASSLQALLLAVRALQLGRVQMAIVGGASDCKADTLVVFSLARALSATGSRPFDADADGMVCGEGYGAIVLKTLDRALADGDRIRAVIRGIGVSTDGSGRSLWAPRKEGQIEAMRRAYSQDLNLAEIQYIEAHATATQRGDATELMALEEVLQGHLPAGQKIPLGSVKGNIGHSLEAAGIAGIIKTVLAMEQATVPPAVNLSRLNPLIDWERTPFYVPRAAAPWPAPAHGGPRRAGVNAFGIGGLNLHVVIDQFAVMPQTSPAPAAPINAAAAGGANIPSGTDDQAMAVIGMGCILPGSPNVASYWELLTSGRAAMSHATSDRWRTDLAHRPGAREPFHSPVTRGGYITDFQYDWRAHKIPPVQIQQADPLQFMLLEATDQALQDAGYDQRPLDRSRAGVLVGTEFGGDFSVQLQMALRMPNMARTLERVLARRGVSAERLRTITAGFADALLEHWPALVDGTGSFSTSALASRISKTWNMMGGATAIDGGGNSSLAILASAVDLLASGDCDLVVCAAGQRRMGLPFQEGMALAGRLATCDEPAAPWDAAASGILLGEGVGVVVLKRLADARRDGEPIRAIVRGVGVGHALSWTEGLHSSIQRALETAQVRPEDVAVLETDSYASQAIDPDAVRTFAAAYARPPGCPSLRLGSVVGQIGYTTAASGVALLIKAALEIDRGEMPAMPDIRHPLPALASCANVLRLVSSREPLTHVTPDGERLAAVATFDRGLSYHVVLERGAKLPVSEWPPRHAGAGDRQRATVTAPSLVTNTAATAGGGSNGAVHHPATVSVEEFPSENGLAVGNNSPAAAASQAHSADCVRVAEMAENGADRPANLRVMAARLSNPEMCLMLEQQGILNREQKSARPRIVFVFPGQGSQYQGMLRQLVSELPAAAEAVRRIDATARKHGLPDFAQLAWTETPAAVSDAFAAQAALLMADTVMLAAVHDYGVRPDALAGHSYGEYAALIAAGAWDFEQALLVTKARCEAIQSSPAARGAMLAIGASAEIVEQLAAQVAEPVYLANYNAPDQVVVGGRPAAIQALAALAQRESIPARLLPVSSPFHTPLLQEAADRLRQAIARVAIQRPQLPLVSGVTQRLLSEPDEIREYLLTHMTHPVRYTDLVRQLAGAGETILVEVGPQQTLTRLNRRILVHGGAACIATDNPKRPGLEPLEQVVVLLECAGVLPEPASQTSSGRPASAAASRPAPPRGELLAFDATARRREHMRQTATGQAIHAPRMPEVRGSRVAALPPVVPAAAVGPTPTPRKPSANGVSGGHDTQIVPPTVGPATTAALERFLVDFVVEHTGYPAEIVELDADLEADLGIDSIRKAQLFAELQPYFDVKPAAGLTLDEFATLRHVVRILEHVPIRGNLPGLSPAEPAMNGTEPRAGALAGGPPLSPAAKTETAAPGISPVVPAARQAGGHSHVAALERFLVNFVVEHTGYPAEIVELDADLEADLGIDSIRKAQLFAELQPYFDVKPAAGLTLDEFATLRHVVRFLEHVPVRRSLSGDESLEVEVAVETPAAGGSTATGPSATGPTASAPVEPAVAPRIAPQEDAFALPPGVLVLRLSGTPAARGRQQGGELKQTIRGLLRCLVGLPESVRNELHLALVPHDPRAQFTADELLELQGLADAAEVPLDTMAALNEALFGLMAEVGLPASFEPEAAQAMQDCLQRVTARWSALTALRDHLVPVVQLRDTEAGQRATVTLAGTIARHPADNERSSDDLAELCNQPSLCQRFVMRVLDVPFEPNTGTTGWCHGAALVFGSNPTADALLRRLTETGVRVHHVPTTGDVEAALDALEAAWREEPIYHLFLTSARDVEPRSRLEAAVWTQQRDRVAVVPFFLSQRWIQRAGAAGLLNQCTLVATTALGGDFGFSGRVLAPEGGAMTGLMKAIHLEYHVLGENRNLVVKAIDAPDDEPPALLAEQICRELTAATIDYEVGFVAGTRRVQNALAEATTLQPYAGIRPGSTWLVTGGARGITARCALELGRRFGLKLHLIGTTPLAELDPSWRSLSAEGLQGLKTSIMCQARQHGQTPNEAWQRVEKLLEIDQALRALEKAGVRATYHVCDVGDRAALAPLIDQIRRTDGLIEGILHGAGFDRSCRFEKKTRENVLATLNAKVDGACHLLALTWNDPVRHFIAFGSVSGRLGSNGQTDYCLANDLLCKLVSAYRTQRPACRAVGFHWHPWDEVGMAARPENKAAIRLAQGVELMPADEGVRHLLAELYAAAPRTEVLITDSGYHARFYGPTPALPAASRTPAVAAHAAPEVRPQPAAALPQRPLVSAMIATTNQAGWTGEIQFDSVRDPFLREHRLGGKPFLPGAVGLEILAEAVALCTPNAITAVRDVEFVDGLVLPSGSMNAKVTVVPVEDGFGCTLSTELRDRQGRLVTPNRVHVKGIVETGEPAELTALPPGVPPLGWFPNHYPDNGVIYHGPPLRCLKDCAFQYDGGWGRIVAPALAELATSRGGAGWIFPPAVLDACAYACAAFIYVQFGARVEIPYGVDRLTGVRQPRAGEVCVVRLYFHGHDGRHSRFDFTLFGEDGGPILQAQGYRTVLVGSTGDAGRPQQQPATVRGDRS